MGIPRLSKAVLAASSASRRTRRRAFCLRAWMRNPWGALALFRSRGCPGSTASARIPEMRGEHVASTMLDFSHKLAINEGRKLILQTILSDSVEPLYLKLGFRRVYLKELFVRDAGRILKS